HTTRLIPLSLHDALPICSSLEQRLERMIRTNPTRIDYAEKLQEMIDRYNAGSANITTFFEELKALARSLTEEEQRHIHEQLTERSEEHTSELQSRENLVC